jgi:hypothetical protein
MEINISINGLKPEVTAGQKASVQMSEVTDAGAASAQVNIPMTGSDDPEISNVVDIGAPPDWLFKNLETSHVANGHSEAAEEDAGAGPEL